MSKSSTKEAAQAENPDVVIVRTATASKLSPRGEGGITYQVGRVGEEVYVRIERNDGGGSHSREFVAANAIRACISPAMRRGEPFKSDALAKAFVGRSQCNSGFLVAALRAEGILRADPEHKGMSRPAGDIDAWEKANREAEPPLVDGRPETAKLHPEPKETKFKVKPKSTCDVHETPHGDAVSPEGTADEAPADSPGEGAAKAKPTMLIRIKRKGAKPSAEADDREPPAADAEPSDGGEATAVA